MTYKKNKEDKKSMCPHGNKHLICPTNSPKPESWMEERLDNFLETLKIHNKDLEVCFNDALAERHIKELFSHQQAKSDKEFLKILANKKAHYELREKLVIQEVKKDLIKEIEDGLKEMAEFGIPYIKYEKVLSLLTKIKKGE